MFRTPSPSHTSFVLVLLALGVLTAGAAFAAPSASIEQVRNGVATASSTPTPTWGTGNAGASNSHYLESHSTAYRAVMDQLPTDGTVVELIIGYDIKRSGSYAIDYLTHFQRLLPHVLFGHSQPEVFNPLSGVAGVGATVTTAPIPVPTRDVMIDPDGSDPEPAMPQPSTSAGALAATERLMTLYGGTLLDVTYLSEGDPAVATRSSETQVKVRFMADSPKAVLAWGGHIACRWDWGFNTDGSPRSAGGISGSSYHMRLIGWTLGSLGSQDRSMSTDAVYPVPRCGISNLGPFCGGTTQTHTAPAGMESYSWSLFDNTAGASIVGSNTGLSVAVQSTTGGSYGLLLTTGASGFTKQCQATVTVNAPMVVDAGADLLACTSSPSVQLAGLVSGGTATWSGGTGSFTPNASALQATYLPSAAEIAAGGVTLTLTGTPLMGPCSAMSDQVRIVIHRAATANAGADQTVCATSPTVQLAGLVGGGATSGAWSGGNGTFTPSAAALNATYVPSADEVASGGLTLTLTSDDPAGPCAAASDVVRILVNPSATANAGPDQTLCASSPQVQLDGLVSGGTATWSGGTGSFTPSASSLQATYLPSATEIAAGGVTLTLTGTPLMGPCSAMSDQVRIVIHRAATANAGADQTVCATSPTVQLAGLVGGGATSGAWSGGNGTFTPSAAALNATYVPSADEVSSGGVTLTLTSDDPAGPCAAASDVVRILVNPSASANAGPDQTLCASSPNIQLAGSVGGAATTGTWSGGAGSFSPNASALSAVYTPTAAEIAVGSVTLVLTTNDPAGPCPSVGDPVRISFDGSATVNAGADLTVCASSPAAQLAGSVAGAATSGTWSGGMGSFDPGASALNATYTPTAAEIAAGGVTLTLTTNDPEGPCSPVSDQLRITIDPAATASAGPDRRVCASSPRAQLQGSVGGGATSGAWSGGAGVFGPNPTTLNATYTPTAQEIAAGGVTLTLTTNDPAGPCPAVSDQMRITIDPVTVVNAGPDQAVCSSSPQVQLHGSVSGSVSTGIWNGGNGSFSPSRTSLNAVYTPTPGDIAAGGVTLVLYSDTPTGPCPRSSDAMTITIHPAVTVNAGPDQMACAASPSVQLAGSGTPSALGKTWTGGAGTFSPSRTAMNAVYTPTPAEVAAGSVTLTLVTNDPAGPCPARNDEMRITFDAPVVTVSSRVVCNGVTNISLCASPSRGVAPYTYLWSTGATTQCISPADTGSYSVTITDAKGCQASGTGVFRWRDCVGTVAHTSMTCANYQDGTGEPLESDEVHVVVKDDIITSISPGVFFYYTKITAPSSSFNVSIVQSKDNDAFPFCEVQQGQISPYDSQCDRIETGADSSPGQAVVNVTGATVGQVFIISVKYSLKTLVGVYMTETMGCHYDFRTEINGQVVDADPDGLQVGAVQPAVAGGPSPDEVPDPMPQPGMATSAIGAEDEGLELYRPVPNPFRNGMRMAYAVGSSGEHVTIRIFDLAGRRVRVVANGFQSAGRHTVAWDGRDEQGLRMHKGMYFVHVQIGQQARQVRVTFLE